VEVCVAEDRVIRPAAVVDERRARQILDALRRDDVASGGVWSSSTALWQRFDRPWDGAGGTRGSANLVGSVFVTYNRPAQHWVTLYRVTVSEHGARTGWSVDQLADELLAACGLTLATCPRDDLAAAPRRDPFKVAPQPRDARWENTPHIA
jgi:hypothetical protein